MMLSLNEIATQSVTILIQDHWSLKNKDLSNIAGGFKLDHL